MSARLRLLATALACVVAGTSPALAGAPDDRQQPDPTDPRAMREQQTSDGRPGEIADPIPLRARGRLVVTNERTWVVAPGVVYRRWDQTNRRGQQRIHLLTVDLAETAIAVEYASRRYVRQRGTLKDLLARDDAVAGINGGFFDISDTGAPMGVGRDRQRGLLHAARHSWNQAFWLGRGAVADIGTLNLTAGIREHRRLSITTVNSPTVRGDGVGVYTRVWGRTAGYAVTDGVRRQTRMVKVRRGTVVANRSGLSKGDRIRGQLLVGRGDGARRLRRLEVGSKATVRWSLQESPLVAISGGAVLLKERDVKATDDRTLHPRTTVGIDRDLNQVLMLVVDGRQELSRGATLVELARLMRRLGAEDALNLDGGGSTTMVATKPSGKVKVVNSPSDGSQRRIPDGLQVTYTPVSR